MHNNKNKTKNFFSVRMLAFAILLLLFFAFVFLAFQGPLNGTECLDEAPECVADQNGIQNYVFWIGIFLCSLFGLILMTFRPGTIKKGPTIILSLSAAAALNTAMWMGLVYVGAFLINLF